MKNFRDKFLQLISVLSADHLFHQIQEENVIERQRFVLFKIFSFTGALVSMLAFVKMFITFQTVDWATYLIPCLSVIMIFNFYAVKKTKNLRFAYLTLLLVACLLLHIVAYTCGGIRTAGTFYFTVIIPAVKQYPPFLPSSINAYRIITVK